MQTRKPKNDFQKHLHNSCSFKKNIFFQLCTHSEMLHNSKIKLKLIERPCVCHWTFTTVKLSFELSASFKTAEV